MSKVVIVHVQTLMHDLTSPILDFYPTDFTIDTEGKRAEWEGVVLIPLIDEARLLRAAATVPVTALSSEERTRNELGSVLTFTYDPGKCLLYTI